jgi:nucleoside-diphosphate-sugar epimerase
MLSEERMSESSREVYLVTGAMGCIGAWCVYHLLRQDQRVVSFDLSERGHRLDLLLSRQEQANITFVRGDLSSFGDVRQVFEAYSITHVIHLAALQVPFCKADPVKGAQVNVVGTVNVFEAARQAGLRHLTYASSIAVYGAAEDYPPGAIRHDAPMLPRTLYGVYKQADEGIARVYWQDHQLSSTALRPYTVYGVGRDQGLTSDPTKAMLAAATGRDYHIQFGGAMQFQYASDVALQFIEAARQPLNGSYGFNLGGRAVTIAEVVSIISQVKPESRITFEDKALPFPQTFDDSELRAHFQNVYETPLEQGIRDTIARFEIAAREGLLEMA